MKNFIVTAYIIYLPVVIALTLYVANNLFKNSIVYMKDIFNNREEIAIATNTLFKIGFYLLNIGFALYILEIDYTTNNTQSMIEALSRKIGGFSIYLGIMLFMNMYMFFRGKNASKRKRMEALVHTAAGVNLETK